VTPDPMRVELTCAATSSETGTPARHSDAADEFTTNGHPHFDHPLERDAGAVSGALWAFGVMANVNTHPSMERTIVRACTLRSFVQWCQ
jgi:hypothetical protein